MKERRRRSGQIASRPTGAPRTAHRRPRKPPEQPGGLPGRVVWGIVALVIVGAAAIWTFGIPGSETDGGTDTPAANVARDPINVVGVEVLEPWADLGHVPLDTGVEQTYTLHNAGPDTVHLGDASIKVLEGC